MGDAPPEKPPRTFISDLQPLRLSGLVSRGRTLRTYADTLRQIFWS
jgi:hypothetical protein